MASSTNFSEKFSLPSLTQQHKLPREKVSLLLLRFQAIILVVKINKNWSLKEKRISFRKLIFYKFVFTREFHKRKKKTK
jgi:hypothetical protein